MNYLPMTPNYYYVAPHQSSSYTSVPTHKQIAPLSNFTILNAISQALSLSLKNYELQVSCNVPQTQQTQSQ